MAKRLCRNYDILNADTIRKAIHDCMRHKTANERPDIAELYETCNDETAIIGYIQVILVKMLCAGSLDIPPVRYDVRLDRSNGKTRIIAIEHITQQIIDYIAYNGLEELMPYIGHYQIACRDGMGPLYGTHVIYQWMQDKSIRYAIKADMQKCYPSIKHDMIMAFLLHRVANDNLLKLIHALLVFNSNGIVSRHLQSMLVEHPELQEQIDLARSGLPIGSVLSIRLCALYLAQIYHLAEGSYFYTRRGQNINTYQHVMINLDDLYLFGSNARQMNMAMSQLIKTTHDRYGLTIKQDWQLIDLSYKHKDAHIDVLGYRIYHDRVTMRHRDYLKCRHALKRYKRHRNVHNARSLVSYDGMFRKHTNSIRFCEKYNVYRIVRKARKTISKHDKSTIRN